MEEIKDWYRNFQYTDKFNKENIKKNMTLYTHFDNEKDTYIIDYICKGNKEKYLKYFYNPQKIKEINENIENVNVIVKNKEYQIIDLIFNIKTDNLNVGYLKKREKMFLEKNDKGFIIYSTNMDCENKGILDIKKGYNVISVCENERQIKIYIAIEMISNIPIILKKIPALIIIKTLLNLNNIEDTEG
jgi:hypothetical protein